MADRTREYLRRVTEFFRFRFRDQPKSPSLSFGENLAPISYQHRSSRANLSVFLQFLRTRWAQSAVIPHQFQGWHFDAACCCARQASCVSVEGLHCGSARGEMICDHRCEREGLLVDARGTGLDADRMFELERAENRI